MMPNIILKLCVLHIVLLPSMVAGEQGIYWYFPAIDCLPVIPLRLKHAQMQIQGSCDENPAKCRPDDLKHKLHVLRWIGYSGPTKEDDDFSLHPMQISFVRDPDVSIKMTYSIDKTCREGGQKYFECVDAILSCKKEVPPPFEPAWILDAYCHKTTDYAIVARTIHEEFETQCMFGTPMTIDEDKGITWDFCYKYCMHKKLHLLAAAGLPKDNKTHRNVTEAAYRYLCRIMGLGCKARHFNEPMFVVLYYINHYCFTKIEETGAEISEDEHGKFYNMNSCAHNSTDNDHKIAKAAVQCIEDILTCKVPVYDMVDQDFGQTSRGPFMLHVNHLLHPENPNVNTKTQTFGFTNESWIAWRKGYGRATVL